jgi:S-adenosylmethionine decarboxylase proenzyme
MSALAPETVTATFVGALESAGATVVQALSHNFPGVGLTCVLILAESHAVLHTWPETGTVNIDIFSCSTRLESLAAIEVLGLAFGAAGVSVQEITRADGHGPRSDGRR